MLGRAKGKVNGSRGIFQSGNIWSPMLRPRCTSLMAIPQGERFVNPVWRGLLDRRRAPIRKSGALALGWASNRAGKRLEGQRLSEACAPAGNFAQMQSGAWRACQWERCNFGHRIDITRLHVLLLSLTRLSIRVSVQSGNR